MTSNLVPPHHLYAGEERLTHGPVHVADASVLDFWRWACSDLRSNELRGKFAEWMVAKLLGLSPAMHDAWDDHDLQLPDGRKIEVKTSGYLQAWRQRGPSEIRFAGLMGKTWTPETDYADEATYNADIYVFCVQTEKDLEKYDVCDLRQWKFWVMSLQEVKRINQKSMGLSTVRKNGVEVGASALQGHIEGLK